MGFGNGIERTIQTMIKQNVTLPKPKGVTLFIIPLGERSKEDSFLLAHMLREQGVSTMMDLSGRKLNKVMHYADHIKAQYVIVVGDDELATGEVQLKEMATGDVTKISIKSLPKILKLEQDSPLFVRHWDEINKPFEDKRESEFFMKKMKRMIDNTKSSTDTLKNSLESLKDFISKNIKE
jgi:histidyl-tRNA synthetase